MHDKIGQDEITRPKIMEEDIRWSQINQINEIFTLISEETTTLLLTGQANS